MVDNERELKSSVIEDMKQKGHKQIPGFAVSSCPIWLYEELKKQASEFYGGMYSPVLVDWCRKAKAYDAILTNAQLVMEMPKEEDGPVKGPIEIDEQKPKIKLFGGYEGG